MAESPMEFRVAGPGDASSIVTLVESAYRGAVSRAGWTTEADILDGQRTDLEEVSTILLDQSCRIVLAHSGGALFGTVMVRNEAEAAYVGMLAIRPDCQARGLGRQLLEQAERLAAETFSANKTEMTVIIQREELIRWYERRGYRRTERREPFPYGNPRFGLPKRPDLEFIVLEKLLGT